MDENMRQELGYLDLCNQILSYGTATPDRTGVGTLSLFGEQLRFDLKQGFPALTTKKLVWRAVVAELLWFIEGSGDERRLAEIQFGSRDTAKKTIWTANAKAEYWLPKAKFDGDLGRIYGVQWRNWRTPRFNGFYSYKETDQLENLIRGLKTDPHSRRHIISAWNPGELKAMALPPCHVFAQFYVADGKLSCQMYQRSCDMFLGVPFNIASYSLLTHMIAHHCGLKVGELIISMGDTHIYENHVEQVKEQLTREEFPQPTLILNPTVTNIFDITMNDIVLNDYQSHGQIKAVMAV